MGFGIWNNLDELGLYLGLERLGYETDEGYANRLKKFVAYKYKTDYYTQAHSIPLQLGLDTKELIKISCGYITLDNDENEIIVPMRFECKIDWEYAYFESFPEDGDPAHKEYIRVFINNHDATLNKILFALDNSSTFSYETVSQTESPTPCKFLIRNSSTAIGRDYVNSKYTKLTADNIVDGSFVSEDNGTCKYKVASLQDLKRPGDYFLDLESGFLQTYSDISLGFFVTYKYDKPDFAIESTDINLIPLNILAKYGLTDQLIEYAKVLLENKVWG